MEDTRDNTEVFAEERIAAAPPEAQEEDYWFAPPQEGDANSPAPLWVPDEEAEECQGCLRTFTLTFRRHHCRGCGHIFCGDCSSQKRLMPPAFGFKDGPKRVCDRCSKLMFPFEPLSAVTPSGRKIEFGKIGQGDQVVLSFHGAPGNYSQGLVAVYPLFASSEMLETYTIIAPSRPGYGQSSKPEQQSLRDQSEMSIQLLDELGISKSRKIIVVGMSAGAPIAIDFALRYPHRVASMVLICPVTRCYWPNQAKGVSQDESEENMGKFTRVMLGSTAVQKAGLWVLRQLATSYPGGARTALKSLLASSSLWEDETIEKHINRIIDHPEHLFVVLFSIYT